MQAFDLNGCTSVNLADISLADILLGMHVERFTGVIELSQPAEQQIFFLHQGQLVGGELRGEGGRDQLLSHLIQYKLVDTEDARGFQSLTETQLELISLLFEQRILTREQVDRAVIESIRRQIFALVPRSNLTIEISTGDDQLVSFHPVVIDLRPIIAFGVVAHSRVAERQMFIERISGRTFHIQMPYNKERNVLGLPPPVVAATSKLVEEGFEALTRPFVLPGLGEQETLGLLMLFDKMGLLREGLPVRRART